MRPPKHSPFLNKFTPHQIAEAMTMIEQSALAQINWRELIDLSWSKSGLDKVRDWSFFVLPLSGSSTWQPPKSVDIVIARFNVVLKWAVSEIVLTEDLAERRHTICQYVHIAAAARDLRNFATMYQITMALLSADISGLKETWQFVPAEEKEMLKELEKLVTPTKNFVTLRREQEGVVVDKGCIPFFGKYNGMYLNIDPTPTTQSRSTSPSSSEQAEPLVNFERYQNAASIVKTVLRLVDASKTYNYAVTPALLSRCLWMCALGDEEIRARSRALTM
ncbi:ras GEF [Rhizodiscina lignyota]|uniref:Ras GEF n=1 Tax=Rhizodiscina lignyota TaxID=1504668 RepID=A0A9P4IH26_9PEZI|nr:ras GEF [Rhizodiscina lignyota]